MRQRNIKNMEKQPGIEQFSLLYTTLNLFLSLKPSIRNQDLAGTSSRTFKDGNEAEENT